jgi:hypothetical protein
MKRIYYVNEFAKDGVLLTGDRIPDGAMFQTFDEALDAFNYRLCEEGKRLVKYPKNEKVLRANLGKRYIELWFITYTDEVSATETDN